MREPDGFRDFVVARYPALVRYGALLCGDPGHGEDLAQAALVKTVRAWRHLHPGGEPEAYTRRVMARAAWREQRRRWRAEVPTGDLPDLPGTDPFAPVDEADAVRRLLAGLPAKQRVVLVLRYWAGLSESEIAAVLHCSPGTVKSRASRALTSLRAVSGHHDLPLTDGADK